MEAKTTAATIFLHVLSPWLSDDSRRGNLMKLGRRRDIVAKKRRMPFVAKIRRKDPFCRRLTACSMAAWATASFNRSGRSIDVPDPRQFD
jgi:hypothetical protein